MVGSISEIIDIDAEHLQGVHDLPEAAPGPFLIIIKNRDTWIHIYAVLSAVLSVLVRTVQPDYTSICLCVKVGASKKIPVEDSRV
jgi:hypothetical protein